MPSTRIAPGSQVCVRRNGETHPAVVVGAMASSSLVWVRINGEDPALVELRDISLDHPPQSVDDPTLWETEIFDAPE
jgi:hypothetical protein